MRSRPPQVYALSWKAIINTSSEVSLQGGVSVSYRRVTNHSITQELTVINRTYCSGVMDHLDGSTNLGQARQTSAGLTDVSVVVGSSWSMMDSFND